jgi:hypothetical protein
MLTNTRKQEILTVIGLQASMTEKGNADAYNKELFLRYTPRDYPDSERQARDDVHRMSETILLHKASGLRLEYITTESYFGDEYSYRLRSMFMITNENKKVQVLDVDFARQQFITADGVVLFSQVKMNPH